jgi:hypothetical protein
MGVPIRKVGDGTALPTAGEVGVIFIIGISVEVITGVPGPGYGIKVGGLIGVIRGIEVGVSFGPG